MSKDRQSVTTNGRAAFYAAMWNDLRQAAMDCGWALGLHGSLNSDMDIMAMPWVKEAILADDMIQHLINTCFHDDGIMKKIGYQKDETSKPNGRVVYTLSIWADFYLDINIINSKFDIPLKEKYNIVELFGKKLKIIDDKDYHYPCIKCALYSLNLKNCTILDKRPCDSLSGNNRHFEEIK